MYERLDGTEHGDDGVPPTSGTVLPCLFSIKILYKESVTDISDGLCAKSTVAELKAIIGNIQLYSKLT
jgi:hypothetical protein